MGKEETEKLLQELTDVCAPTGFEGPVRSIVNRHLDSLCHEIQVDGIGSLIAQVNDRQDGRPNVMLAAHMDEVGLMVKYITEEGYVKFQTIGGWLDQALINQRWVIRTKKGLVKGITGIKTPHVIPAENRGQVFKKEQMFIDIGALDKNDAVNRLGIGPGDPIAPDSVFANLNGSSLYVGKAWDDRIGLAVMIQVAARLQGDDIPNNLHLVSTVQEEVGLRGAQTSSYLVEPDIGINLESGVAGDYPGANPDESQEKIGFGPAIFLHDSSMIPNLKLRDFVLEIASQEKVPIQFDVLSGYGQDGAEIQRARGGSPSINIAIPTRYLHSHNGVISIDDFDNAVRLVTSLVRALDGDTVREIRRFDLA
tara:strand:- start:733 stop:1830 length:1098 start_codon:yes stop_codon:yes gene_type:complete